MYSLRTRLVAYSRYLAPITVETFGEMSRFMERLDSSVRQRTHESGNVSVYISRTGQIQGLGRCLSWTSGFWFQRHRRHHTVVEMIRTLVCVHEQCVDWIRDNLTYIQQFSEFDRLLYVFTQTQKRIVLFVEWYLAYTHTRPLDTFLLREIYREHLHRRGTLFLATYARCKSVWSQAPLRVPVDMPTIYEQWGLSSVRSPVVFPYGRRRRMGRV